jgi:hypothetical protein
MNLRYFVSSGAAGAVLCALFLSCGNLPPLAGGTSETTNGITAQVIDTLGMPVSNAVLRLRPSSYLTDTSMVVPNHAPMVTIDTTTDRFGRFRIESLDTGAYSIEIQGDEGCGALYTFRPQQNRIYDGGSVIIKPNGRMYGVVDLSTMPRTATVYVQVYGLERLVRPDLSTGSFIVNNLPEGKYTVRVKTSCPSFEPAELNSRQVHSGAATGLGIVSIVPFEDWGHSREILLNTSASGAGVYGTIRNFPVLVRLTANTFDFSEAASDGSDIRFAKHDGTPLPYEIERWDPVTELAEVWVRTDTIFGNDSTQSIMMYWGNSGAPDESNGSAVFAPEAGFSGVWHLCEEAPGRGNSGVYRDATGNGYDGRDDLSAAGRDGIIGYGKNFDNRYIDSASQSCDKIVLPASSNFVPESASPLTISMWMKPGNLKNDLNRLFTVMTDSIGSTFIFGVYRGDSVSLCLYVKGPAPAYVVTSTMPAASWHHGAVRFDDTGWQLFVDGTPVDSATMSVHGAGGSMSATIGGFVECLWTEPGFDGALDEVRFENNARSPDWVRLCYMNQKAEDKLVVFK